MIRYLRDRCYRAKPQRPANGATQSGARISLQSAPLPQSFLSNISQKFLLPALLMLRVPEAVTVSQVDQRLTTLKCPALNVTKTLNSRSSLVSTKERRWRALMIFAIPIETLPLSATFTTAARRQWKRHGALRLSYYICFMRHL